MRNIWERYDAQSSETGSKVFTSLITALKRLITEKPSLLGVSQQMMGVGVHHSTDGGMSTSGSGGGSGRADGGGVAGMAGMVATAASATVSGVVGMIGSEAGLSLTTSAMKLQWCDFHPAVRIF